MPQNPDSVTNPDLVDIADQGDGPTSVDQPVTVGPSQVGRTTVDGDDYSPCSPSTSSVIANTVVGQVHGTGTPINVFR